ncbi:A-agglutinin anchorage subunit-like [Zerene cesonia]|uniref:A-agglutinin anchorage subunit-like n=1 Tax=Zerene cesonia TaxID=33412 RepID=UPI0018E54CA1|nr:A-agglutinin anchorage subunit-like [Zerene cesonia]
MSNSSIMSIREMIDTAFGESDVNVVNFKLIQTVLYILARQLRVLERRVQLTIQPSVYPSSSSLSVTEVKIKASMAKKKKIIKAPPVSHDKTTTKPTQGQTKPKPEAVKTPIDLSSSSKTISDPTKSSTSKSSSSKTTTVTTKTTTELSSSTKSTTEPTESTSKTTSDFTKTSTDKSSSSKTTSDLTKTSTFLSSSSKTTSDQTKTSTEKSSSSKTTTEPTKTSTEKSSTEMSSSLKTSTDKSSTDKSSSSKSKSTSDRSTSDERKKKEFHNMLQIIEEQREREIRTIHQRANSQEEAARSPTPMASLDTMETQYEKLLIERKRSHTPQVSVVTQEQFENLAIAVRAIQSKFGAIGKATFPENPQLMQELRRGASLTNAMAALQLSARLEAAEKTLDLMMTLVTEMAIKKGLNVDFEPKQKGPVDTPETKIVFEASSTASQEPPSKSQKHKVSEVKSRDKASSLQMSKSATSTFALETSLDAKVEETTERSVGPAEEQTIDVESKSSMQKPTNLIKPMDLEHAMKEMYDGIMKAVYNITNKTSTTAENALKTSNRLESKLEAALDLGDRMDNLDSLVSEYVEQINIMDTNLSSQMTNYQEQLTQMQHDLESGLENMAEAMANTGGDTVAVAELNAHFTDLQVDFDNTNTRQKELKEYQDCLSLDLQALLKQIEILRETKSDREEVADALRDKAGLGALNGLVTLQQFNAVRGDFEKRIGAAYDKFNNQEIIWQKAIDDLLRELNEKADLVQVMCLRDDVNNNLDKLNNRLHAMMEIVGEPRAAAVAKRLFRNTACLSCNTPARMEIEEPGLIPAFPAFPKTSRHASIGAEGDSNKDKEDYKVCYPGQPIQHPIDERAHICTRYCGGSHTIVPSALGRTPEGMIVTSMPRNLSTGVGSDGKTYLLDEEKDRIRKPCVPCNQGYVTIPQPSEADQAPTESSDMVPWDFMPLQAFEPDITEDVTPPPPADDLD